LLGAAVTGAAALAGCGSQQAAGEAVGASVAPAASTAAASPGAPADVEDLSAGLLPAEAFGAGGVAPLTADELAQQVQSYRGPMAGQLAGVSVTPESCTAALAALPGAEPQEADLHGFAAQMGKTNGTTVLTVEVLAAGPVVADAVEQLSAGVAACPEATVDAPQVGSATVAFQTLDAPDLADGAAAVSVATTVTPAGAQPITASVLVGMAQDGDRLVTLVSTGPDGALDPDAFLALLDRAHQHAADALD
jgi:hypothetical protein